MEKYKIYVIVVMKLICSDKKYLFRDIRYKDINRIKEP